MAEFGPPPKKFSPPLGMVPVTGKPLTPYRIEVKWPVVVQQSGATTDISSPAPRFASASPLAIRFEPRATDTEQALCCVVSAKTRVLSASNRIGEATPIPSSSRVVMKRAVGRIPPGARRAKTIMKRSGLFFRGVMASPFRRGLSYTGTLRISYTHFRKKQGPLFSPSLVEYPHLRP